jgi:acyl-CoA thioesterase
MLARDAASRMLGLALEDIAPGSARVSMTVREDMVNGHGSCQGGILAALADTAFALACNSYGETTVAAGFDITFLAPGRSGDRLLATAVERARQGRSGLYDVTVVRRSPGKPDGDVVLAEFRGRSRSLGRPIG